MIHDQSTGRNGSHETKNVFVIVLIFVLSKSLIDCLVMMTLFFHIVW